MDAVRGHAPACKTAPEVGEEARRSAEVEIGLSRDGELLDRPDVETTPRVVVLALPILRTRLTEPDATSTVAQSPDELTHLGGEGLRAPVAGTVQPPDLPG